MTTEQAVCTRPDEAREVGSLAREMARAYSGMAAAWRDRMGLSLSEGEARAREPLDPERLDRLQTGNPDQVSWWHLSALTEHDPDAAILLWEHLKREAQDELLSGHRAAQALEFDSYPWQRAQYLALRSALAEQWQPTNGIEQVLIDTLAQAQTLYLEWLALFQQRTICESALEKTQIGRDQAWELPRLDRAAAIEEAAAMADRWNRLFLRTLRQLRDLRRYTPAVVVQSVGQLNIGQQQMNVAPASAP